MQFTYNQGHVRLPYSNNNGKRLNKEKGVVVKLLNWFNCVCDIQNQSCPENAENTCFPSLSQRTRK